MLISNKKETESRFIGKHLFQGAHKSALKTANEWRQQRSFYGGKEVLHCESCIIPDWGFLFVCLFFCLTAITIAHQEWRKRRLLAIVEDIPEKTKISIV